MKRVESSYPDRMEFASGGGCALVFCAALLVAGLAGATSPLWKDSVPSMYVNEYLAVPIGIAMAVFGFIGVFGRTSLYIDRRARVVVTRWHVLGLGRERSRPFDAFEAVSITRREQSSGSDKSHRSTFVYYPVAITGREGDVPIDPYIGSLEDARSLAAEVAAFMGLEVVDNAGEGEAPG